MQPSDYNERREGEVMRVRQNVAPAAIGAAFLLYFGFFHLAEPNGTDLFNRANLVFYYTLRFGGVAMAAISAWSVFGHSIALSVDAVATVAIGGLLILTGLGMAVDGGDMLQTIINVVCGGMFISSGGRNWRDFRFFTANKTSNDPPIPKHNFGDFDRRSEALPEACRKPVSASTGEGRGQRESTTPIAPPPEGFLASLANSPPRTDDKGPRT